MRAPTVDFMSPQLADEIAGHLGELLSNPKLTVEVTYRRVSTSDYSPSTGTATRVTNDFAFSAVMEEIKQKAGPGGRVEDMQFLFPKTCMDADPRKGDEIVVGSDVWLVVSWDSDLQELQWLVKARRSGA